MAQKIKSRLLYALTRELTNTAITLGVCYGLCLGLIPRATPEWVVLFLAVFLLRVNLITTFSTFFVTFLLSDWLAPLFHHIGRYVLVDLAALNPFWRALYNAPLFPYLQFNNTIVMGAFLSTIILMPITFYISLSLLRRFRPKLRELILRNYFWRMLNTQHFERRAK